MIHLFYSFLLTGYRVNKFKFAQEFNRYTLRNDLAVLKLSQPLPLANRKIRPVLINEPRNNPRYLYNPKRYENYSLAVF